MSATGIAGRLELVHRQVEMGAGIFVQVQWMRFAEEQTPDHGGDHRADNDLRIISHQARLELAALGWPFPSNSMPQPLQWWSYIIPLRYVLLIIRASS